MAGVRAIEKGDLDEASRLLNGALNGSPRNSHVHTLNALIYHLMVARGDSARFELAEAGYQVARQLDPGNVTATRLLGRLYLDTRRHQEAKELYAEAVLAEGPSVETLQGLAAASYYSGDLELAVWAVRRLDALGAADASVLRMKALVEAAAGEAAEAARTFERFAAAEPDAARRDYVQRRIAQWAMTRATWNAQSPRASSAPTPTPIAPAAAASPLATPAHDESANGRPLAPYWADCPQATVGANARSAQAGAYGSSVSGGYGYPSYGSSGSGYSGYGSRTQDEAESLPALPSPCTGAPLPRMVQVDATIIRTDDDLETGKGVNILDGLAVVLTGSRTSSRTIDGGRDTRTRVWTRGLALPNSGIKYALNIFNVTERRAEVLARPSLLALDRQPSRFFSGANITVAVSGQYAADLEEKPVGVSLSVTPTFVDDDTVLLAVKVARSFFETSHTGATFEQQVQTAKNSVTASVLAKFDQTVVISGLNERQFLKHESGVPLLRDVPIAQYFFSRETERSFNHNVLILLTPRRPVGKDGSEAQAQAQAATSVLRQRLNALRVTPNLAITLEETGHNRLFAAAFRGSDLALEDWTQMGPLKRMINEIVDFLYF